MSHPFRVELDGKPLHSFVLSRDHLRRIALAAQLLADELGG
ncbi:MAG TPA: hypothetical protein VGG39_08820 [Polyangiaceae bacterium]|jgi:hypothetical protein